MIFSGSRYRNSVNYPITAADGSVRIVLRLPLPGPAVVQGYYPQRTNAQRLDLIANYFLKDGTASWQLCDANNAVAPDALAARSLVGIPLNGT